MLASALLILAGSAFSEKVDPGLQASLASGLPQTVFVLLNGQYIPHKTFDAWAAKNIDADRLELRKTVVKELKSRAAGVAAFAKEALGEEADVRPTWIVKGFGARLSLSQVEKLVEREEVLYLYPAGALPPKEQAGKSPVFEGFGGSGTWSDKVPWNVSKLGAERVHKELEIQGLGSVVAMFEPGVDIDHLAIYGGMKWNLGEVANNGKDDDGNGYVDDTCGYDFARNSPDPRGPEGRGRNHGTMTTGIIVSNPKAARIAIAPQAKAMPIINGGMFTTLLAFEYAIVNGADVVNMSFSIPNLGNTRGLWRLAAEHATAAGLVLVSGVGNFQQTEKVPVQIRVPEGIPCVIGAGGVDENDKVPPFCSLGPVEWASVKFYEDYPMPEGLIKPDVCGFPGAGYPVLDPEKPEGGLIDPNDRVRGNSFSGPHVSGTVALMFQANPKLTAMKVKQIIESTARDIDPPGKDNRTGSGVVDAYAAVREAIRLKG